MELRAPSPFTQTAWNSFISCQARATLKGDWHRVVFVSHRSLLPAEVPGCIHPLLQVLQRHLPNQSNKSLSIGLATCQNRNSNNKPTRDLSLPCRRLLDLRFIQASASPLVSFPACILPCCLRMQPSTPLCHFSCLFEANGRRELSPPKALRLVVADRPDKSTQSHWDL